MKYGIRAFSANPGAVATDLGRHMTEEELAAWGIVRGDDGKLIMPAGFKKVEQGAATSVWCATSPQLEGMGGLYCEDSDVAELVPADHADLNGVRPWVIDAETAERLWAVSENLLHLPAGTVA